MYLLYIYPYDSSLGFQEILGKAKGVDVNEENYE